ncbi:hypothetical protein [Lacticaseibacillus sp. N501-2]|uniref:hypothetical protein n=1 Tax=Lacticaseibacillus salsurae TaxID=3367729 RepID=UPI0038B36917
MFEKALREWDDLVHSCGLQGEEAHGGCEFDPILIKYKKDYDAAFPDDMPVIPKEVGEYIKNLHKFHRGLVDVFGMVRDLGITRTEPNGVLLWVANNTNTFARAWGLGAWHIQETREVVKL